MVLIFMGRSSKPSAAVRGKSPLVVSSPSSVKSHDRSETRSLPHRQYNRTNSAYRVHAPGPDQGSNGALTAGSGGRGAGLRHGVGVSVRLREERRCARTPPERLHPSPKPRASQCASECSSVRLMGASPTMTWRLPGESSRFDTGPTAAEGSEASLEAPTDKTCEAPVCFSARPARV